MHEGLIGRVIAGQRIESVAGRGGMGVVYRAIDLDLDRAVAVKVIADAFADDPGFRRRFIAESRIAASLDHPNVIPIYRAGEEDGVLFHVMRFVDGKDLRGVLADARAARRAAGRAHAHADRVRARCGPRQRTGSPRRQARQRPPRLRDHVYLTDFGLSKRSGTDDTRTAQLVGTVNYVAPEQIRGQEIDARMDVYALGAVLFQMLTGRVPFPADSDEAKMWAHISEPPPRPSESRPELPDALDEVIARAMAKDRDRRFVSAGDLAAAATAALEVRPARVTPSPPPSAPPLRAAPVPYSRSAYRRALVLNAMTDSLSVVAAAVILIAGLLFGALTLAVPLALIVYAGGARARSSTTTPAGG